MTGAVATWLAATSGQAPLAQNINQFFSNHPMNILWTGTQTSAQLTAGATTTSTNNLWLAQSFTTGASQTTVGYVNITLTTTSTSATALAPTTVSIYTNSAGAPGTALVSTTVTAEYANKASGGVNTTLLQYITPVSGLTPATTYWIVVKGTSSTGFFTWFRSNQVSGASTSPTGATWTTQAYGFEYAVFDASASGQVVGTWEDSGARWVNLTYNNLNQIASIAEYTTAQNASYTQSFRTLTYLNGFVSGVA